MTKVVSRSGRVTKAASHEQEGDTDNRKSAGEGPAGACEAGERRCCMIAEAAYFRALARNFAPGHEIDDWLQAERDIEATLLQSSGQ